MITIIILFLIIIAIVLMAVVLLQSSKGNGLAGPIGGASVTMAFGVRRTSDILSKATTVLAVVLMVGCIAVNLLIGATGTVDETIIQKNAGQQQQQMPPQNNTPPDINQQPAETNKPPVETNQPPQESNEKGKEMDKMEKAPTEPMEK
jgi:preprotein translocase subunit SecG